MNPGLELGFDEPSERGFIKGTIGLEWSGQRGHDAMKLGEFHQEGSSIPVDRDPDSIVRQAGPPR